MNGALIALIVIFMGVAVAMWMIQRNKGRRSDKTDRP